MKYWALLVINNGIFREKKMTLMFSGKDRLLELLQKLDLTNQFNLYKLLIFKIWFKNTQLKFNF